ncbi:HlyD family secretion protein [Maribacter litoralis]|uniref:HlyD family secretion protein n=1 Tax=Maribacter litoralis TaxID=2059726 RepID=UPI003F5CE871
MTRFSGALEELYVANGDTVAQGQPLAIIRNTAHTYDVLRLKRILDTLHYSIHSDFPIDIVSKSMLGDIGTAYIAFEKSYLDFHLLQDLEPHSNRIAGNKTSILEMKRRLHYQIIQKELLQKELALQQTDFQRYKILYEKGVISQQEYEAKQGEQLQMEKNNSSMSISISQMREAIASASHTLKESTIDQQEDSARLSTNLLQSYNVLRKAVQDWEYNYLLSSSISGKVSFQEFWGENQYVNSGEVVFTVFPYDADTLVGKIMLPSQNAGKVIAGQKVLVKLDNFPYQQFGMLMGKVKNISVSPNKDGYYFVYISLPSRMETSYKRKLPFDQELLGNAEIITENLSIAERIFYKFKDIFKYN